MGAREAIEAVDQFVDELASGQVRYDKDIGISFQTHPECCDDLTLLRGLTPPTQDCLHRSGVFRFKQIALWTPSQADNVSGLIGEDVQRHGWQQQARDLHYLKHGEKLPAFILRSVGEDMMMADVENVQHDGTCPAEANSRNEDCFKPSEFPRRIFDAARQDALLQQSNNALVAGGGEPHPSEVNTNTAPSIGSLSERKDAEKPKTTNRPGVKVVTSEEKTARLKEILDAINPPRNE